MYVSTTVFSPVSNVSGFVEITLSPALIFSIATKPVAVRIIVPATKQVNVSLCLPIALYVVLLKTANALTVN